VLGTAQTLRGGGSVNGDVTASGRITPGSSGIGTLTFGNKLALGVSATVVMEINKNNSPAATNDMLVVSGTFTPGGSLVVTNIGGALVVGDSFQLFNNPVVGSFSLITLPTAPGGSVWTNKLTVNGTIALVAAPAPSPTNITFNVSGTNLILNWPAGQGWKLQSQTNANTVGLGSNWVNMSNAVPPFTNAMNPANPTMFYRLVWP